MKLYKQTTPFTCGPSCALIILNHFFGVKLSRENELETWKEVMAIPFKITLPLTLANFLISKGLKVSLISQRLKIKKEGCEICFKYENVPEKQRDTFFDIFDQYYNVLQFSKFKNSGDWIKRTPILSKIKRELIIALIDTFPLDLYLGKERRHIPDWIVIRKGQKLKVMNLPLEVLQEAVTKVEEVFHIPSSVLLVSPGDTLKS
ncbi:MAG TPA: hypothetical protein ENF51_00540 [Candidatus Aenigmarchaeota archaeon]|nr:hypothetical protein [Candidatus Aenigmarchaeota archaeon]